MNIGKVKATAKIHRADEHQRYSSFLCLQILALPPRSCLFSCSLHPLLPIMSSPLTIHIAKVLCKSPPQPHSTGILRRLYYQFQLLAKYNVCEKREEKIQYKRDERRTRERGEVKWEEWKRKWDSYKHTLILDFSVMGRFSSKNSHGDASSAASPPVASKTCQQYWGPTRLFLSCLWKRF